MAPVASWVAKSFMEERILLFLKKKKQKDFYQLAGRAQF
jgi:hypothetical protein